jgi:hypothetical protein
MIRDIKLDLTSNRNLEFVRNVPPSEFAELFIEQPPQNTRVSLWRSDLRFQLSSYPLFIQPEEVLNPICTLIYHAGHGPQLDGSENVVRVALANQCNVLLLEMPRWDSFSDGLQYRNTQFAVVSEDLTIDLAQGWLHDQFELLEEITNSYVLDIFLQPIFDSVSFIENQFGMNHQIVMAGLSGGGWSTHVASAIDQRIDKSIAVAGSTLSDSPHGDFEQRHPYLINFGYSTLYAMSAYPINRQFIHAVNWNDTCCFSRQDPLVWMPSVEQILKNQDQVAGRYDVFVDHWNIGHSIGPAVIAIIDDTLSNNGYTEIDYSLCKPGSWSPTGRASCKTSSPGTYTDTEAATVQKDCPRGMNSPPSSKHMGMCFARPPQAISTVSIQINVNSVTLTWTAPLDGGLRIEKYKVRIKNGETICETDQTECQIILSPLITSLTLEIIAINALGEGPSSAAVDINPIPDNYQQTTVEPRGIAITPAPSPLVSHPANKRVTLRWRAVEGATSYVVTTTRGTTRCETAGTSCVISRLRNGKAYTYLVYSVNANGVRSDNSTRLTARPGFQVKRTTLKAKRSLKLSSIVTTPSKGAKTWRVTSGRCRISGTRLIAPTTKGTCKLRLASAKRGSYPAMSSIIRITVTR